MNKIDREIDRVLLDVILLDGEQDEAPDLSDMATRAKAILAKRDEEQRRRRGPSKVLALPGKSRQERRGSDKARQRKVYRAVDARSGGRCEETNGVTECGNDAAEHDHFWGRGKVEETPENVWHLCKFHHDQKTIWDPSRRMWIERFRIHCMTNRYYGEVAKCDAAIALEKAQHPEARKAEAT